MRLEFRHREKNRGRVYVATCHIHGLTQNAPYDGHTCAILYSEKGQDVGAYVINARCGVLDPWFGAEAGRFEKLDVCVEPRHEVRFEGPRGS